MPARGARGSAASVPACRASRSARRGSAAASAACAPGAARSASIRRSAWRHALSCLCSRSRRDSTKSSASAGPREPVSAGPGSVSARASSSAHWKAAARTTSTGSGGSLSADDSVGSGEPDSASRACSARRRCCGRGRRRGRERRRPGGVSQVGAGRGAERRELAPGGAGAADPDPQLVDRFGGPMSLADLARVRQHLIEAGLEHGAKDLARRSWPRFEHRRPGFHRRARGLAARQPVAAGRLRQGAEPQPVLVDAVLAERDQSAGRRRP